MLVYWIEKMSSICLTNRFVLQRSCDSGLSSSSSSSSSSFSESTDNFADLPENDKNKCANTSAKENKTSFEVLGKRKYEGDSDDENGSSDHDDEKENKDNEKEKTNAKPELGVFKIHNFFNNSYKVF
mgnify:CR=1 FL=1